MVENFVAIIMKQKYNTYLYFQRHKKFPTYSKQPYNHTTPNLTYILGTGIRLWWSRSLPHAVYR